MNTPRSGATMVSLPDGVYIIGGNDGKNNLYTVERYDENLNEWFYLPSMNY